jgi:hypothetical protein
MKPSREKCGATRLYLHCTYALALASCYMDERCVPEAKPSGLPFRGSAHYKD